jgi:hypothetical protein
MIKVNITQAQKRMEELVERATLARKSLLCGERRRWRG